MSLKTRLASWAPIAFAFCFFYTALFIKSVQRAAVSAVAAASNKRAFGFGATQCTSVATMASQRLFKRHHNSVQACELTLLQCCLV